MKRLLLLFLASYSINCTLYNCESEPNVTKCFEHEVEDFKDFSCHRTTFDISAVKEKVDDFEEAIEEYLDKCHGLPNTKERQDIFWKINHGSTKERDSFFAPMKDYESEPFFTLQPEKDFFDKNETIQVKAQLLSSDDMKIARSRKHLCL